MFNTITAIGADAAARPLQSFSIKRRGLLPDNVEIAVLYCGICHSNLHQINNDFGAAHYPMVPGHEIVGRVMDQNGLNNERSQRTCNSKYDG